MSSLHAWVEQTWWRTAPPPWWLRCMEPIYATISSIHLRRRAASIKQPPLPLISVGNITAGGSGKTPFVLWLAAALISKGVRPVILCRGDGGKATRACVVKAEDSAAWVGDEARMLAELSGCPVIAAHDRIAGSRMAESLGDVIILDDGFQYRQLGRCCDIVLVPADGVGNGHQIPAGPLREPLAALARADIIVRTGNHREVDSCKPLTAKDEYCWVRRPGRLMDIITAAGSAPASLYAVTAIARPQRFFDDLQAAGLHLDGSRSYPDHHPFSRKDVSELVGLHPDIAVTAKDAVKLAPLWPQHRPLWVLPLSGEAQPPEETQPELIEAILKKM